MKTSELIVCLETCVLIAERFGSPSATRNQLQSLVGVLQEFKDEPLTELIKRLRKPPKTVKTPVKVVLTPELVSHWKTVYDVSASGPEPDFSSLDKLKKTDLDQLVRELGFLSKFKTKKDLLAALKDRHSQIRATLERRQA